MAKLDLQFFGGRGSGGTRNTESSESYTSLNGEQESEAFFEQPSERWKYDLSNREEVAINEYTMYNNKQINEYLRDGVVKDFDKEDLQEQIDSIDSAISKYELPENVTLYRAGNSDDLNREFASFVSTSTSQTLAESYLSPSKGADTLFVIQTTKGKGKGAYVASVSEVPEEQEFLLNRGLKPTVVNRGTREINGRKVKVVTLKV